MALRVADRRGWPPHRETRKSGDNASGEYDARQLRRPPSVLGAHEPIVINTVVPTAASTPFARNA
jgi:hypothetical protein